MPGNRGSNVKHKDRYESLKDTGVAREHAARIANGGEAPEGGSEQLPLSLNRGSNTISSSTTKGSR